MKVALAQTEIIPGRPQENFLRMKARLMEAVERRADLLVFPEMSLPGYLLGDLWEEDSFVEECLWWGHEFVRLTKEIAVVFGNVAVDPRHTGEDGRPRKYNAAYVAQGGRLVGSRAAGLEFFPKTLMPNYREFDDSRHFHDLRKLAHERHVGWEALLDVAPVRLAGETKKLGVIICEDGWSTDYGVDPAAVLVRKGADLLVNCSCSPYTFGKGNKRRRVFGETAGRVGRPLLFVNNVGVQNIGKTYYAFDGRSAYFDETGIARWQLPPFEAQCAVIDLEQAEEMPAEPEEPEGIEIVARALQEILRSYLADAGLRRVVVGVSGGIDSAVVAALIALVVGPENLLLANMPTRFNSATTRNLARDLAERLGAWYVEVPVEPSVELTVSQVEGLEAVRPDGNKLKLHLTTFHLENVQARDRSSRILAALASAFGGVFTCNANKAEATVGYSTLYGDHGGFFAPLADLWKHQVYALGRHLNDHGFSTPVIPEGIFTVVPSAELSDAQAVDEGKGDPLIYWYHDYLFRAWVERWRKASPQEILEWYAAGTLEQQLKIESGRRVAEAFPDARSFIQDLERWWGLYKGMGVVKRVQAPPVAAVSRRAFGFVHRESFLGVFYS
jgi:NAD+ synthase (glutamine-hydrolysing)